MLLNLKINGLSPGCGQTEAYLRYDKYMTSDKGKGISLVYQGSINLSMYLKETVKLGIILSVKTKTSVFMISFSVDTKPSWIRFIIKMMSWSMLMACSSYRNFTFRKEAEATILIRVAKQLLIWVSCLNFLKLSFYFRRIDECVAKSCISWKLSELLPIPI